MRPDAAHIVVKKVHEPRTTETLRVLVDRLWPRGVSKVRADLDAWSKDVAPSTQLRKAVHSGDMTFKAFEVAYREELERSEAVMELAREVAASEGKVALLIASDPSKPNHAVILREALTNAMKET